MELKFECKTSKRGRKKLMRMMRGDKKTLYAQMGGSLLPFATIERHKDCPIETYEKLLNYLSFLMANNQNYYKNVSKEQENG